MELSGKQCETITDRVRLAAQGDEAAFEHLIEENLGMLYRVSRSILKNEADAADAMQDAVITAWRRIGQLRNGASFPAWIARICVRRCYRIARSRRPRADFDEPQSCAQNEARMDVADAVLALPEEMRPVVSLYYFEDWNVREIARALGLFEGTVKSRLHRARKLLLDSLRIYREEKHDDAR